MPQSRFTPEQHMTAAEHDKKSARREGVLLGIGIGLSIAFFLICFYLVNHP